MAKFWDEYSLQYKLYELGRYSCYRKGLIEEISKSIELENKDILLLEKLLSGDIKSVIEIDELCDGIINKNIKAGD